MTHYTSWIAPAPAQHIGNANYRYETESIGAIYTCDHSLEHRDLTRFAIFQGDGSHAGVERIELDGYQQTILNGDGKDLWVSYSFMVESPNVATAPWTVIGQVKALGSGPACNFELRSENGGHEIRYIRRTSTDPNAALVYNLVWSKTDFAYDTWYRVVERFKPDATGGTGRIQVWFEGSNIVDYTGNTGMSFATGYYFKFGIYRADNGIGTPLAAQYANVEVSNGSLFLRIADPLPIVRILPSV